MSDARQPLCQDCDSPEALDRRFFLKSVAGAGVAAAGLGGVAGLRPTLRAADAPPRAAKPAEDLIKELYSNLSAEQKTNLVMPWDHKEGNNPLFTRHRMFNAPLPGKQRIEQGYTAAQQELVNKIFVAISSGEDGLKQLTRNGTYDSSRTFGGMGAYIFGEPVDQKPYALVFMGHHLTIRCDGNSEANAAFGGPMYYGHSADGDSQRNVFNYQTRAVQEVFANLSEAQRRTAVVAGNPGEQEPSVRFRAAGQAIPGLAGSELTADQKRNVEAVMRAILSPYRREDADEVMDIVRRNGGMDKIHLAFYREGREENKWAFWRLEGPGFVWNYRVLPHVHTFVNIRGIA